MAQNHMLRSQNLSKYQIERVLLLAHTLCQCPLRVKYKAKQFNLNLKFTLAEVLLAEKLPSPNTLLGHFQFAD